MLVQTTAQKKILNLSKRIRIVKGGTSASKTFSILPILIQYAVTNPNIEISVVSESMPHLKRGAIRDFLKIMQLTSNYVDARFNKTSPTYKFANGSFIEFFSADMPDKLRGARRDILFINECNNISFEAYQQLAIRTRKFIYLDYNPTNEFWVNTELQDDEDAEMITLTYKDNEALEPSIIKEIEKAKVKGLTSTYWANWWKVYGLGMQGILDGIVYPDWTIIDLIPEQARLLGTGLDFGFTNDPTAAIDIYKYNDGYILDEIIYQKGLHNSDIAKLLKDKRNIIADSAEPKSISELQRYNLSISGAVKGAGSVSYGIQLLQSVDISVTKRSINTIKEMRKYSFDQDKKTNTFKNVPVDMFNHAMDAARYIAGETIGQKQRGSYHLSPVRFK
jgi:phage terminase large subunit